MRLMQQAGREPLAQAVRLPVVCMINAQAVAAVVCVPPDLSHHVECCADDVAEALARLEEGGQAKVSRLRQAAHNTNPGAAHSC